MKRDRTAIVTGAASGIGRAVATMLALEDCAVALLDVRADGLAEAADAIRAAGGERVWTRVVDVRDAPAVEHAVRELDEQFGRIDILINNVGGNTTPRAIEEMSFEEWGEIMDLNLRSMFVTTRTVVPVMKRGGWGRIVNLSSIAGRTRTMFSNAAYTAAKAGVIGFTRQCAAELAPHGIAVNAVAHGVIATERVAKSWASRPPERQRLTQSMIPADRLGTVEEAAYAVHFFCGEQCGYAVGSVLDMNGGFFIG
jgi:NAD(P)-dependent dehydrogenase (short-subunit alcohol dehydrogenase family)